MVDADRDEVHVDVDDVVDDGLVQVGGHGPRDQDQQQVEEEVKSDDPIDRFAFSLASVLAAALAALRAACLGSGFHSPARVRELLSELDELRPLYANAGNIAGPLFEWLGFTSFRCAAAPLPRRCASLAFLLGLNHGTCRCAGEVPSPLPARAAEAPGTRARAGPEAAGALLASQGCSVFWLPSQACA